MRHLIILITLLLSKSIYSQGNYIDSTYVLSYRQIVNYHLDNEFHRFKIMNLNTQIKYLDSIAAKQDTDLKIYRVVDSIHLSLIKEYKYRDSIKTEQLKVTTDVVNNYKMLFLNSDKQLKISEKELKAQKFWKGFYKYGGAAVATFLGLKLLLN